MTDEPSAVGLMAGIKVVEVATWAFVPSAWAVMAEWGADVVKIEDPVRGDPQRGVTAWGIGPETGGIGPFFQMFNRGKRSIGIDLRTEGGHAVLMRLVSDADIFLTNFLPDARTKLRIDVDDLRARNPSLIYARGSAQGPDGPERGTGGFDLVSYWARSGAGRGAMAADTQYPAPLPCPAFGDVQSAMNLAGGVMAALFHRARTGRALVVD